MCADPVPIDDGRVAQTVVRYTGPRFGSVCYTGEKSGRRYPFDRLNPCQYVLAEDLSKFRQLPEFEVLDDTQIDPATSEIEVLARRLFAEQLAAMVPPTHVAPPSEQATRPGRPRIPDQELQRLWHLKHHVTRAWSNAQLAYEFIKGSSRDPVSAIAQRLHRIAKRPELIAEDACQFCKQRYDPSPPQLETLAA